MFEAAIALSEGSSRLGVTALAALTMHAAAAIAWPASPGAPTRAATVAPSSPHWVDLSMSESPGNEKAPEAEMSPQSAPPQADAPPVPRAPATAAPRPSPIAAAPMPRPRPVPIGATREAAPEQPVGDAESANTEMPAGDSTAVTGATAPATSGSAPSHPGGSGGAAAGTGSRGRATAARLLARGDPCAGYFPASASAARGRVRVAVSVDARGAVTSSQVLAATPSGSGFERAALACAARLRFAAAKTSQGTPVAGQATLVLHFTATNL